MVLFVCYIFKINRIIDITDNFHEITLTIICAFMFYLNKFGINCLKDSSLLFSGMSTKYDFLPSHFEIQPNSKSIQRSYQYLLQFVLRNNRGLHSTDSKI